MRKTFGITFLLLAVIGASKAKADTATFSIDSSAAVMIEAFENLAVPPDTFAIVSDNATLNLELLTDAVTGIHIANIYLNFYGSDSNLELTDDFGNDVVKGFSPMLDGSDSIQIEYGTVTETVFNSTPEPSSLISVVILLAAMAFAARRFRPAILK
jgi:hypothetical protein